MNNTYPITGGRAEHRDPTGSTPLTCCAVQLKKKKENSGKASGQFLIKAAKTCASTV